MATILVSGSGDAAHATDFTASSQSEFESAVNAANADQDNPHVITITADFTMTAGSVYGIGNNVALVLDGGGHTITYEPGAAVAQLYAPTVDLRNLTAVPASNTTSNASLVASIADNLTLTNVHLSGHNGLGTANWLQGNDSVVIVNSSFDDNTSTGDHGTATYITTDALTVIGSSFSNNVNTSPHSGAAIYAECSSAYILGSTFTDNSAYKGAGIALNCPLAVVNSTFDGNEATAEEGGAIFSYAPVNVTGSTFRHNTAMHGGAIGTRANTLNVDQSTFEDNTASSTGGALYANGSVNTTNSTFLRNSATYGGAIGTLDVGDTTHINSTFIDNYASYAGGAIDIWSGAISVSFSTFVGNESPRGAHIQLDYNTFTPFASVFADAVDGPGCTSYDYDAEPGSLGFNVDEDGRCANTAADINGVDAGLKGIADNGGTVQTVMPTASSPAVAAVPQADCEGFIDAAPAEASRDARGLSRVTLAASKGSCTAGAAEFLGDLTFSINGPTGPVDFVVSGAIAADSECQAALRLADLGGTAPAGVSFPHGAFRFCAETGVNGAPITVSVTFPAPVTSAFKVTDSNWATIPGVTFSNGGRTVTYVVRDGGALDEDGSTDGSVLDPLVAGVAVHFTG